MESKVSLEGSQDPLLLQHALVIGGDVFTSESQDLDVLVWLVEVLKEKGTGRMAGGD